MRSLLLLVAMVGCRGKSADAVAPPVITITAQLDGANAERIELEVAQPIEEALHRLPGVRAIESRSRADAAIVSLELARSADLERTTHDVRHALAGARLPRESLPPVVSHARRDDRPILWLALRGNTLPVTELSTHARRVIAPALERVPGVANVEEHGLAELAVIVRPDLDRLAALGLPLFDVLAVLQSTEVGQIDALGDVVIKQVDGALIRLHDVATVEQGFEREPGAGEPALAIRAQSNAKRPTVLAAVREALRDLELPSGIEVSEAPPPAAERSPPSLVVTVQGPALDDLDAIADDLAAQLAGAGVTDVVRDPPAGELEPTVLPDRDRAAALGIPLADIFATLRAVSTRRVGRVIIDGAPRSIVLKLATPALPLDKLVVRGRDGALIPLSAVASVMAARSRTILRRNRERAIVLSVNAPAALLAAARKRVQAREVPAGYRILVAP